MGTLHVCCFIPLPEIRTQYLSVASEDIQGRRSRDNALLTWKLLHILQSKKQYTDLEKFDIERHIQT